MAHKNKTSGIYSITSPSSKMYIGQSIHVERRLQTHKSMLRRGIHTNSRLQGACNKYGLDKLTFTLVERCDKDQLDQREQWWIDNNDTQYNMSRSASNCMADSAIAKKVSKTKKSKAHVTAEQTRLRWQDPGFKKTMAEKSRARWQNQEYRKHLSEKRKEMWATPGFKEKITVVRSGSKAVQTAIEKLVAAHKIRASTESYKQTMRDVAAKKRTIAGPGKKEIAYASRDRLGSPELSKKLSGYLTARHSNTRYCSLLEAGLLLYSLSGLKNIVLVGRRSAATKEQQRTGKIARNVLRHIKE